MSILDNINKIRNDLDDNKVMIVAVTKNANLDQIKQAYEAGLNQFAESRIQDASLKMNAAALSCGKYIDWHFIGHVQTNKVKNIVGNFSLIHSVDSQYLLESISNVASQKNIIQEVLLQVKFDENKFGFRPIELLDKFECLYNLPNISIKGLMTMAPLVKNKNLWFDCFDGLRILKDKLIANYNINLKELSMGMSDDYLVAVSCGATIIRLGRAIFN